MELDKERLNELNVKVQEFLFLKASQQEVSSYLITHNVTLDTLLGNLFFYQDYENNVDSLVTIIDKLFRWEEFKTEFIILLLQENNSENIFAIKSPLVKRYLVDFITKNIKFFIKEQFLYKLIKIYIVDHISGVYEKTLNLLEFILTSNDEYKNYIFEIKYFNNLLTFLENIKGDNSIILIRELEIILKYFSVVKDDTEIENVLKTICSQFINYDILTLLTFLDTLEKNVKDEKIVLLILKEINFFQLLSLGENIPNEILRKMMYTVSKFYASKILNDNSLIKNFLGVSLQYYEENKDDNFFIMSIILNTFNNRDIFSFLMDPNNNIQIDFLNSIIQIIVLNYYNHDPKVKQHTLEVVSIIGNFNIPSVVQEQFLKKFLIKFYFYEYDKNPTSENDYFGFFIEKLYKDFRTHDFEEYELIFLDTILSLISYESLMKKVVVNFDLILYLLNRRNRPQEILLIKLKIIEGLFKSNLAISGGIDKNLLNQFESYIKKGPY